RTSSTTAASPETALKRAQLERLASDLSQSRAESLPSKYSRGSRDDLFFLAVLGRRTPQARITRGHGDRLRRETRRALGAAAAEKQDPEGPGEEGPSAAPAKAAGAGLHFVRERRQLGGEPRPQTVSTKDLLKQEEQRERSTQSAPSKIQRREWLQ
ncbi:hypothetical protein E2320_012334, partial [Naja naja]